MRIRKRQVGLPLSSLSPVPLSSLSLSDPYTLSASGGSHIPPVQLLRPTAPAAVDGVSKNSKPSDQFPATNQPPIGGPDTVDHTETAIHGEKKLTRNDSSPSAASKICGGSTQVYQSSFLRQGGRWHEGEKSSSPLKKRRNRDNLGKEEEEVGVDENVVKTEDGVLTPNSRGFRPQSGAVKKRGRGAGDGTVMEGSRCSRVNGRGWRCCQPTLVGYSLCEHHLGKGRLRSMMNVRSRRQTKPKRAKKWSSEDDEEEDEDDEEYVEERKTKKGPKLGMVKARSMSSLLGQADDDNSKPNSSGATPAAVVTVEGVGSDNVNKPRSMEEA
ncbi:hypothetical protein SAY86_007557 [Trapa natans]|uniref:WRC domain-containing protein n=1 Tax=Trapa natans TaxID=22666 RepID=A0AAN7R295_TRANT|nr:hypothetical protein SAY86_007557 [Trapa natans]